MSQGSFDARTSPKRSRSLSTSPPRDGQTPSKKARTRNTSTDNMATKRESLERRSATGATVTADPLEGEERLGSSDESQHSNVCAITNSIGEDVETTHIIPKNASPELLDDLEFAWGMQHGTLDVNEPRNLLPLTRNLKESFEAGQWALLPTDIDLVSNLSCFTYGLDCGDVKTFLDIYKNRSETVFSYQLIPLPGLSSPIVRFEQGFAGTPNAQAVTYSHPYGKFPQLSLPIYPHFAMIDLGKKAALLTEEERFDLEEWFVDNQRRMYGPFGLTNDVYIRWLPTRKFDHEYSHLPPLDRVLNRLIHPDDSHSRATTVSVDTDPDVKLDASVDADSDAIRPRDFYETYARFRYRIILWRSYVLDALAETSNKFGPPMTPELHSFPPAPSSGRSDNGPGASS